MRYINLKRLFRKLVEPESLEWNLMLYLGVTLIFIGLYLLTNFALSPRPKGSLNEPSPTPYFVYPWENSKPKHLYAYDVKDRIYKRVSEKSDMIWYESESGIYQGNTISGKRTLLISKKPDERMTYEISNDKKFIIFNTSSLTNKKTINYPVYLYSLETKSTTKIADTPEDTDFGRAYWSRDNNTVFFAFTEYESAMGGYYAVGPSKFYSYSIKESEIKHIVNSSNLMKNSSVFIAGESSDLKYLYFDSYGEGDKVLLGLWKINLETLEQNTVYEKKYPEIEEPYNYVIYQDYEKGFVILSEARSSYTSTDEKTVSKIDLKTGRSEIIEEEELPQYSVYFSPTLKDSYLGLNEDKNEIFLYKIGSNEKVYSYDIGQDPYYKVLWLDKTNDGYFTFRASLQNGIEPDQEEREKAQQNEEILGLINPETRKIEFANIYTPGYDQIIRLVTILN